MRLGSCAGPGYAVQSNFLVMLGRSFRTSQWRVRNYFWDLGGNARHGRLTLPELGDQQEELSCHLPSGRCPRHPHRAVEEAAGPGLWGWVGAQAPCMKISPPRLCRGLSKPPFKEISLHPLLTIPHPILQDTSRAPAMQN